MTPVILGPKPHPFDDQGRRRDYADIPKAVSDSLIIRSASHGAGMDTSHLLAERQKTAWTGQPSRIEFMRAALKASASLLASGDSLPLA